MVAFAAARFVPEVGLTDLAALSRVSLASWMVGWAMGSPESVHPEEVLTGFG